MPLPARGLIRAIRTAALAVLVLGISTAGHLAGGGQAPGIGLLGALAVPVLAACTMLTRRRLTMLRLVAAMGSGQVALHEVMAHSATTMASMSDAPSSMHAEGVPVAMLSAHAVTTLLLAAAFAAGEGSLWRLRSWLAPLRLPVPSATAIPQVGRPLAADDVRPVLEPVLAHTLSRRGPPAALAG